MKKYRFKGILLALGLVLTTLSMQAAPPDSDKDARADAPWFSQYALTKAALSVAIEAMNNARVKIQTDAELSTQRAAIEALKQANEAFKVEIQALDAVKRDQDDEHFINEFNQHYQTLLTQTNSLEAKLPASLTWTEQLAMTNTALTTASNAVIEARSVLASTVDFPAKRAAIKASRLVNEAFKVEIQLLDAVKKDQDDGVIVTTFNDQHQALKTQINELEVALEAAIEAKRVADLAGPWPAQLALTNTALTTANTAVANATSVMNSDGRLHAKTTAIEASKQANAAFKVEIQALDAVKRDQDDGVIVTTFNDQHQALKTQIAELEVALAAAIEAKRVADLAAQWQAQLALTNTALTTAYTLVANATSVMNSDAELSAKTTAVVGSKHANAAFKVEIQALKLVERDATDEAVTTAFNDQYQTFLTQTTALEARLAAPSNLTWPEQLAITNTAHSVAANAVAQATTVMNSDADLADKLIAIDAAKQANIAFNAEIQVLDSVKRGDQDSSSISSFNAELLRLVRETDALVVLYNAAVVAKRSAEERQAFLDATLVGHWKNPVIKGLNYKTATHPSGVTDETGAFKCQPGEVVAFSIENLSLTQVDCQAILQTKRTKSVSLSVTTEANFKDWQDEEGKQVIITKVLFGLFNDNIKTAFAQADEALKFITVELTEVQKGNTANQSLDANDLSVMVQDVLGTTEAVVLPTTEQATHMLASGWQANKVFDTEDTKPDTEDTKDKVDTNASEKSSGGGGCAYNPNATGRADMGFILLMVLSAWYLVRRKRLIS